MENPDQGEQVDETVTARDELARRLFASMEADPQGLSVLESVVEILASRSRVARSAQLHTGSISAQHTP